MDVYVESAGVEGEEEEDDGVSVVLDEASVGFADGEVEDPVSDVSSVDEDVLPGGGGFGAGRPGGVALDVQASLVALDVDQVFGQLRAEQGGDFDGEVQS